VGSKGGGFAATSASCGCGCSRGGDGGGGGGGGGDGAAIEVAAADGDLGEGNQPDFGATSGVALASFFAAFESNNADSSGFVNCAGGGGEGERPCLLPPPAPLPLASPV